MGQIPFGRRMEPADAHPFHSRSRFRQGRQGRQRHVEQAQEDGRPVVYQIQCGRPVFQTASRTDFVQARGSVPGTSPELGIHIFKDSGIGGKGKGGRKTGPESAEPFRIHGRGIACSKGGGSGCDSSGFSTSGGYLGKGEYGSQRPGQYTLDSGGCPEICTQGSQEGQCVPRHNPGPARLWTRPGRREVETGRMSERYAQMRILNPRPGGQFYGAEPLFQRLQRSPRRNHRPPEFLPQDRLQKHRIRGTRTHRLLRQSSSA